MKNEYIQLVRKYLKKKEMEEKKLEEMEKKETFYEEETESPSKFILCVLPTQLGKTFTAISKIITEMKQDNELGRSVHIIFTMNSLLNNEQFANRLQHVETEYGKGSVCIFASKYDGEYAHVKNRLELNGLCLDKITCPRIVVMCNNTQRHEDGTKFIQVIDNNKTPIERVFAYFDELHEYISDELRIQIRQIHDTDIVKGIVALTASPDNIFEKSGFWSKIRLIYLNDLRRANYAGCRDMEFNCIDDYHTIPYVRPRKFDYNELDRQTIGFIKHVLTKYPDILKKNTRSFIPAHVRCIGHNAVRDLIFKRNEEAVVIVINGFEKTLQYKKYGNIKTLPLISEGEEVCETISRIIFSHRLENRPIVITGLLCVGMGQTMMHKSMGSFTSAIFGHMDLTNDDIYQLFGRITGRIKDWKTYVPTQVYCPTIVMNRCITMEECAKNMSDCHNGKVVTNEHYREPMTKMGQVGQSAIENIRPPKKNIKKNKQEKEAKKKEKAEDADFAVFSTQEEGKLFVKNTFNIELHSRDTLAPKAFLQKNHGNNPPLTSVIERMWGIISMPTLKKNKDKKTKPNIVRMVPLEDTRWCVYWRPSIVREYNPRLLLNIEAYKRK